MEKPNRGEFHDHRVGLVPRGDARFPVEAAHNRSCLQGRKIVSGRQLCEKVFKKGQT